MESSTGTPLLDALQFWAHHPHGAFYTPGHKRGQGIPESLAKLCGKQVFQADLPELPALDNLFAPTGVIQQAQELAAAAFGADRTWFLTNGSTCGIEAAVLATCQPGDKVILPRNAHQSAIAALILSGAIPIFVEPDYDPTWDITHSITPAGIQTALEHHPDARAVLVICPTYYGVCGNVEAIAQLTQQYHIPLLVDEAHGAHFAFHPDLPIPALAAGADLAVQSTHKVLGAMTQAAMLHVKGDRIDPARLSRALQLLQSTSPNYILLASLDAARQQMVQQGRELMTRTLHLATLARTRLCQLPGLTVLSTELAGSTPGFVALDPTRLTIDVTQLGLTGFEADERLGELGLMAELPSLRHLAWIISLGNTLQDIERLVAGFAQLIAERRDRNTSDQTRREIVAPEWLPELVGQTIISPREAFFAASKTVAIAQAAGHISAELVCPYPPGIPLLLPGEQITAGAIEYLQAVSAAGGMITGCADPELKTVKIV